MNCSNPIPNRAVVDGVIKNLQNRKYCLVCSPFGSLNRTQLHKADAGISKDKQAYNKRTAAKIKERRFLWKKDFVMLLGGQCNDCGYDKNLAALDFHHLNPAEKSFEVSSGSFTTHSRPELEAEVKKCKLLCRNCHSETHYPHLSDW